jgi:hypothetical protein
MGVTLLKHPVDSGLNLGAECVQIGDSPFAEALPREDARFARRLIETNAVNWGVVIGEMATSLLLDGAEDIGGGASLVFTVASSLSPRHRR